MSSSSSREVAKSAVLPVDRKLFSHSPSKAVVLPVDIRLLTGFSATRVRSMVKSVMLVILFFSEASWRKAPFGGSKVDGCNKHAVDRACLGGSKGRNCPL